MRPNSFIQRLEVGKANNFLYSKGDLEGLVSVWKHQNLIVLTWEECPKGQQYDESSYTCDERFTFDTTEKVLLFLMENELPIESFTP